MNRSGFLPLLVLPLMFATGIHASSQGLDYNSSRQTIHRNFNRWIANLALEVQRELGKK